MFLRAQKENIVLPANFLGKILFRGESIKTRLQKHKLKFLTQKD